MFNNMYVGMYKYNSKMILPIFLGIIIGLMVGIPLGVAVLGQLDHESSTEYFKKKLAICSQLEGLGVLEGDEVPEEYKDLVKPEIYEDCKNFLYK